MSLSLDSLKNKFSSNGQNGALVAMNILSIAGCKIEGKVINLPPQYDNTRVTLGDISDARDYLAYIEGYKWEWMEDLYLEKKE